MQCRASNKQKGLNMLQRKKILIEQGVSVNRPLVRVVVAHNSPARSQGRAIDLQRTRPSPRDDTGPIYSFDGKGMVRIR
jgi:hypothetical protein